RSNEDNFKRRRSWSYCKSYIDVQKAIWKRGHCSLFDLLYVTFGQLLLYISPMWLMKWLSNTFLRKNDKNKNFNEVLIIIVKKENKTNKIIKKFPVVKKSIKRVYQLGMYAISPKIKSEGDLQRISPKDGMEYFFGYYDKSPWDITDRYMLCLRTKNTTSSV